jgi:hypothetical protein
MSTIDFNKPATTDLYTAWPTSIQGNQQSLGFGLDPTYVTAYTNLVTGMKRINSATGLIEQWNGTAWAAMSTGYLLDTGDTMTGVLLMNNNVAHSWKDSGGTARSVVKINSSNLILIGDVDNAITGSVAHIGANGSVSFDVNGVAQASLTSTALSLASTCVMVSAATESLRTSNSSGFISFYNTAGSTRTGYMQALAGSQLSIVAENGASLVLATNGAGRVTINPSGNVGFGVTPSAWSALNAIESPGFSLAYGGTTALYLMQNLYYNGGNYIYKTAAAASLYYQSAGVHAFYSVASGTAGSAASITSNVYIDPAGNLLVGNGFSTATSSSAGRGLLEVNGSSNALITLCTGGTRRGYFYFNGTNVLLNADTGTLSLNNAGGSVTLNVNGSTSFSGAAATVPQNVGSTGGAVSLDFSKSNVFYLTLTSSMTTLACSNQLDGQTVNIFITQDGTGGRTIGALTAANGYLWPGGTVGVLSTAAGAKDLLCMTWNAAVGRMFCTLTKGFA